MKLNVATLDPAGNITLIVTTPVDKAAYADIAGKLLDMPELRGEQVGFLTRPKLGGTVRLEMMGGEFCGNALRSTGYYYAVKNGIQGNTVVSTEISGSEKPLGVLVDTDHNTAKAEVPLPLSIDSITANGREVRAVVFEGIIHFIVDIPEKEGVPDMTAKEGLHGMPVSDGLPGIDEAFIQAAVDYAVRSFGAEAAGVIFLDRTSMFIRPVVYVHGTGSLVHESSCASGSTAAALVLASDLPDGEYAFDIRQPGGIIEVGVTKSGGVFAELSIGGRVTIDEERSVELP